MAASDLHEVRAVTANYFFWQGLRWIPLGISLALAGVSSVTSTALPPALSRWGNLALLLIALWLSTSVLGGYYRRTFGQVRADPAQHARRTSLKWFVVYPAMMASMAIDIEFVLPILVSGVVWGLSIELYRRSTGGGRAHYAVVCVGLIAFALLPLANAAPAGKDGVSLLIAIVGVVYIIGGILDHRALVRILGRTRPS